MLFSKFRRRRRSKSEQIEINENKYEVLVDKNEARHHVVDLCEQIIDAAREYEDDRSEYIRLTRYLKDIEVIENLPDKDKKELYDAAYNISRLNKTRNEFIKADQKISDSQFIMIQEHEEEIPAAINRLKDNEEYLNTIQKDLNYLAGEKATWDIGKAEYKREQAQLRNIAIGVMVLFGIAFLIILIAYVNTGMEISLPLCLCGFVGFSFAAYCFLKYQECSRGIRKCEINKNKAISLENRVKIKYVNMKNAVDYTCQKYHVNNADEFNHDYEMYLEMIRDRERFRRTSDELERYNKEFLFVLVNFDLYDSRVWLGYTNAIIEPKEMVELKHDLISRRQKLRSGMEYNINVMTELRSEILLHRNELGSKVEQVNTILRKISKLNLAYD